MFVIDSETKQVPGYGYNPGGSRGIRIGSAKDGKVIAFIPDPEPDPDHSGSTGGEGIAEFGGVIYGFGDHRQKMVAQGVTDAEEARVIADNIKETLSSLGVKGKVTVSSRGHVKVYTDSKRNIEKMRKILGSVEAQLGI